jgi:hypothetical protein
MNAAVPPAVIASEAKQSRSIPQGSRSTSTEGCECVPIFHHMPTLITFRSPKKKGGRSPLGEAESSRHRPSSAPGRRGHPFFFGTIPLPVRGEGVERARHKRASRDPAPQWARDRG